MVNPYNLEATPRFCVAESLKQTRQKHADCLIIVRDSNGTEKALYYDEKAHSMRPLGRLCILMHLLKDPAKHLKELKNTLQTYVNQASVTTRAIVKNALITYEMSYSRGRFKHAFDVLMNISFFLIKDPILKDANISIFGLPMQLPTQDQDLTPELKNTITDIVTNLTLDQRKQILGSTISGFCIFMEKYCRTINKG